MSAPVLLLTIPMMHMQFFMTVDQCIDVGEMIELCNLHLNPDDYFYALYDVCDKCLLDSKALMSELTQGGMSHVILV